LVAAESENEMKTRTPLAILRFAIPAFAQDEDDSATVMEPDDSSTTTTTIIPLGNGSYEACSHTHHPPMMPTPVRPSQQPYQQPDLPGAISPSLPGGSVPPRFPQ
jgi:hypothetical protein